MKKVLTVLLAIGMCLALAACSKNPVTGYKSGDVTLGQYRGITYTALSTEVTEDDVIIEILDIQSQNPELEEITDRTAVQSGDTVKIDYEGIMDGVAFDGGTGSTDLVIGSGRFIPGFEDALIGKEVGSCSIDVTFPEEYENNPDLAGRPATFNVTINGIYKEVTPDYTDEWVESYTEGEYKTKDEFYAYIEQGLKDEKLSEAESQKNYDIVKNLIAASTINKNLAKEISDAKASIISYYDQMISSYYGSLGITDAATFYAYLYGMTEEDYDEYIEAQAKISVQYDYIRSAIVEAENITASEQEIEETAANLMSSYGLESVDALYEYLKTSYGVEGKTYVAEQVKLSKATELVVEAAVGQAE